jgi:hypothetical protein
MEILEIKNRSGYLADVHPANTFDMKIGDDVLKNCYFYLSRPYAPLNKHLKIELIYKIFSKNKGDYVCESITLTEQFDSLIYARRWNIWTCAYVNVEAYRWAAQMIEELQIGKCLGDREMADCERYLLFGFNLEKLKKYSRWFNEREVFGW